MSDTVSIVVPQMGDFVTEVTVAKWLKKPGDWVEVDEMLVELETDKVSVEVPATHAGILREIAAGEGATVGVDALLAMLELADKPKEPPSSTSSPSNNEVERSGGRAAERATISKPEPNAEEWAEFKRLVLEEYISQRLDSPDGHLSYVREKLSGSRAEA